MPFISSFLSTIHAIEHAFLSVTSHARLSKAADPKDFDVILKRMLREVKFYGEAVSPIL